MQAGNVAVPWPKEWLAAKARQFKVDPSVMKGMLDKAVNYVRNKTEHRLNANQNYSGSSTADNTKSNYVDQSKGNRDKRQRQHKGTPSDDFLRNKRANFSGVIDQRDITEKAHTLETPIRDNSAITLEHGLSYDSNNIPKVFEVQEKNGRAHIVFHKSMVTLSNMPEIMINQVDATDARWLTLEKARSHNLDAESYKKHRLKEMKEHIRDSMVYVFEFPANGPVTHLASSGIDKITSKVRNPLSIVAIENIKELADNATLISSRKPKEGIDDTVKRVDTYATAMNTHGKRVLVVFTIKAFKGESNAHRKATQALHQMDVLDFRDGLKYLFEKGRDYDPLVKKANQSSRIPLYEVLGIGPLTDQSFNFLDLVKKKV
ncbi:MAG: hypothetical protein KF784_02305 [Fimbriimonadaceae bacterium]|nr:hypothetical protein [Fimbriimonadaceae bacterium]